MNKVIHCPDHYGKWHDIPAERFVFRASAYGVLRENGKILMVEDAWEKKWELPGGGSTITETLEEGLVREYFEESGLLVRVIKFLTFREGFFYNEDIDLPWHSLRFFYEVEKVGGEIRAGGNSDDVVKAAFMDLSSLTKADMKPGIYDILQQIYGK